jgi:hypothetical protein
MRTIEDVLGGLRAEFLEMPGLRLNPEQVQRLCHVERTICQMMLDVLVDEKFLCVRLDGQYARIATGHDSHPAKADLRTDNPAKRALETAAFVVRVPRSGS